MAVRSQLRVEGNDDSHALRHLLMRHGVDYGQESWPTWFPSIEETGGKDKLLETLALNVRASSGRAVGFVLDANSSLQSRWDAVAAQLGKLDLEVPEEIPREGFVGESRRLQARVGVWLMPDNRQEGTLEHFLETLVQSASSGGFAVCSRLFECFSYYRILSGCEQGMESSLSLIEVTPCDTSKRSRLTLTR